MPGVSKIFEMEKAMLYYEMTYRLTGPEIFHIEVAGNTFAECAYKFASKMQPGYVVLDMRFVKEVKL